jgi:ribosome biogenesis protein BRX1
MGKKRKQVEALHASKEEMEKKHSLAPARPPRSLTGWKDGAAPDAHEGGSSSFRNREKVLVTCSRRINYR